MNIILTFILSSSLLLQQVAFAVDLDDPALFRAIKDVGARDLNTVGAAPKAPCHSCDIEKLPRVCPTKLDEIERNMKKSGWFNIDAPTKECRGAFPGEGLIKKEFKKSQVAPAKNIELALGQKIHEKFGLMIGTKSDCLYGDDNKKAISLAEYYSNIDRLSTGILGAVNNLANMDGLLGNDPLAKECLDSENKKIKEMGLATVMPREQEVCLKHQSCAKENGDRFNALVDESSDFLKLRNLLKNELAQRRNSDLDCLSIAPSITPEKDFNHFGDNKIILHQDLKVAYASLLNAYNDGREMPPDLRAAVIVLKQNVGDDKILTSLDAEQGENAQVRSAKSKINSYFFDRFGASSSAGHALIQVRDDLRRLSSIDLFIEEQLKKRKSEYSTFVAKSQVTLEEAEVSRGPGPKRMIPRTVTQAEMYIADPEKKGKLKEQYTNASLQSDLYKDLTQKSGQALPRNLSQARLLLKDRLQMARENVTGLESELDRDIHERLLENMLMAARHCQEDEKSTVTNSPKEYQEIQAKLTELDHLGEMIYPWIYKKHFQEMRDDEKFSRGEIAQGLKAQLTEDRGNIAQVLKKMRKVETCHVSEDIKCSDSEIKQGLGFVPFSSENNMLGTDVKKSGNPHAWGFVEALNCTEAIKETRKISDDAIWSIYETGIVSVATMGLGAVISSARLAAMSARGLTAAKATRLAAMLGLSAIDGAYIGKGISHALESCREQREAIKLSFNARPGHKDFSCPADVESPIHNIEKNEAANRSCLWAAMSEGIVNGLPAIPGVVGLTRYFKSKQKIKNNLEALYPSPKATRFAQAIVPSFDGKGYTLNLNSTDLSINIPVQAATPKKAAEILDMMSNGFLNDVKLYKYLQEQLKLSGKTSFTADEMSDLLSKRHLSNTALELAPEGLNLDASIMQAKRKNMQGIQKPLLSMENDKFIFNLMISNHAAHGAYANTSVKVILDDINKVDEISRAINNSSSPSETRKAIAEYQKTLGRESLTLDEFKTAVLKSNQKRAADLKKLIDEMGNNSTRPDIAVMQRKVMESAQRGRIFKVDPKFMPRNEEERLIILKDILKRDPTPIEETLVRAAHKIGSGKANGWSYTREEISEKLFLLRDAGFSRVEAREMVLRGVTGEGKVITIRPEEFSLPEEELVEATITQMTKARSAPKTLMKEDAKLRLAAFREQQKKSLAAAKAAEDAAQKAKVETAQMKRDMLDWSKDTPETTPTVVNTEKPRNEFNFDEVPTAPKEASVKKQKVKVIFASEEKKKGLVDTIKGWFGF